MSDLEAPYPKGTPVETPYPLNAEQETGPREAWPWLSGVTDGVCDYSEWIVIVTDPAVENSEGHPVVFRDATEIREPEAEG